MVLIAALLLQDSLSKAVLETRKQTSYSFSFSPGGQKGKGVTGVVVPGAVYLKDGALEVVRSTEVTLVRLDGGEWKSYIDATSDPRMRARVDALIQTPSPHLLAVSVLDHFRKPVEKAGIFTGDLADAYARQLPRAKWFARTDGGRWAETKGSLAVIVGKEGLVAGLQFDLRGKLLPADGRGIPKKPPKKPDPRSARKYQLPEVRAVMHVRMSQYGKARLPVPPEIGNRLGLTQQTK
jgi:hypothetical protein